MNLIIFDVDSTLIQSSGVDGECFVDAMNVLPDFADKAHFFDGYYWGQSDATQLRTLHGEHVGSWFPEELSKDVVLVQLRSATPPVSE